MEDSNIVSLSVVESDERRATVERVMRNLEALADITDRLATLQFKYYTSLVNAGFDSFDARNMAGEWRPSFFG